MSHGLNFAGLMAMPMLHALKDCMYACVPDLQKPLHVYFHLNHGFAMVLELQDA